MLFGTMIFSPRSSQARAPQAKAPDIAFGFSDADAVAWGEGALDEHGDAAEDVGDRVLRGEGERQTAYAQARQHRPDVIAGIVEADHDGEDGDDEAHATEHDHQHLVIQLRFGVPRQADQEVGVKRLIQP